MDQEEIMKLDPAHFEEIVNLDSADLEDILEEILNLEQALLEQPLQKEEETPQHNLVDVDEAIQSLPPELREKIYKEFVSTKIRERKKMGWKEVHNDVEGAPFIACDHFYYTDEYLSNFEREEIHKSRPRCVGATVAATTAGGGTAPTKPCGCRQPKNVFARIRARTNRPRRFAGSNGGIPADRSRRSCQGGRRGQKSIPRNNGRNNKEQKCNLATVSKTVTSSSQPQVKQRSVRADVNKSRVGAVKKGGFPCQVLQVFVAKKDRNKSSEKFLSARRKVKHSGMW